jgi:serine/threonine protein kinase
MPRGQDTPPSGSKQRPWLLQPGETLGPDDRYVVETRLGFGSFSEIYKVCDTHAGRYCALKYAKPDANFSTILRTENNVLESLQDTIPRGYGAARHFDYCVSDTHSDHSSYIVMEMLGTSLSDVRKQIKKLKKNETCERDFARKIVLKSILSLILA